MSKIPKNSVKKLNFSLIFGSLWITPSHVLLVTPQFLCQMRGPMEVHNRGKFGLYSISGCEVKKFEIFSWRWSIHEMAHFRGLVSALKSLPLEIIAWFFPRFWLLFLLPTCQEWNSQTFGKVPKKIKTWN